MLMPAVIDNTPPAKIYCSREATVFGTQTPLAIYGRFADTLGLAALTSRSPRKSLVPYTGTRCVEGHGPFSAWHVWPKREHVLAKMLSSRFVVELPS